MSMIDIRPYLDGAYRFVRRLTTSTHASQWIDIGPPPLYDIAAATDKRTRTLRHLIKANHVNHALLFNNYRFHNHIAYSLGSAYALGGSADHLEAFYTDEAKSHEPWVPSPSEISDRDWRERLGDRRYYRAYIEFFEDELAMKFDFDWKLLVHEYMFTGEEPMINNVIGGLGHPLIHLAYAYEFNSKDIAIDALAMAAASYTSLHKYIDDPTYTRPASYSTTSPLEVLQGVRADHRFDKAVQSTGTDIFSESLGNHEAEVLDHWNAWTLLPNARKAFEAAQRAAVAVVVHSVAPGKQTYDFFLLHLLTTCHAVRVLLPLIPKPYHMPLLRQWWLLVITTYISQSRPEIHSFEIKNPEVTDWRYINQQALTSGWAFDSHYVKGLRAIKDAAALWGDEDGWFLASAVKFADGFDGWTR